MLKFSIIIPAHNEADYIEKTLAHVQGLAYPKECYEAIVIENGSTDQTYELARKFERGNIHVLQSEQGISRAKNLGTDSARADSDWFVFLDADTLLKPAFLEELNVFLSRPNKFSVGTVSLLPEPDRPGARLWFKFYDFGHRLTKTSYSIKMVKRSLFPPVRFDVHLIMAEDLNVIMQARQFGDFFFMPTKTVFTSTRRFDQLGWWYILFYWVFVALLPQSVQRRFPYPAAR